MPNQIDYKYQFVHLQKSLFFSFLQNKVVLLTSPENRIDLKCLRTLQHPWTNWHAPTMWILVNAKTDLGEFLGPRILSTTWT